jgi:hypothetical protein
MLLKIIPVLMIEKQIEINNEWGLDFTKKAKYSSLRNQSQFGIGIYKDPITYYKERKLI